MRGDKGAEEGVSCHFETEVTSRGVAGWHLGVPGKMLPRLPACVSDRCTIEAGSPGGGQVSAQDYNEFNNRSDQDMLTWGAVRTTMQRCLAGAWRCRFTATDCMN